MSVRTSLAAILTAVVIMTGCTAGAPVPPPPPQASDPTPAASADLAEAKRAAGIADCPVSDPDVAPLAAGLPDVTLSCLGGGPTVRLAGLRGQPMIINVWAQWCGPCRAEAPYLAEIAAASPAEELMILGVDFNDPRPAWAIEFAELASWRFPQLADPEAALRTAGITAPPQTLFVTPDGAVAYRHVGPFESAAEIRALTKKHLGVSL